MSPKKEIVSRGKYLSLVKLDGYEMVERVNCSGVVMIIPLTAKDEAVFVEQFRAPIQKRVIEFPAGLVNDRSGQPHEDLRQAAERELLEETGFACPDLRELGNWPTSAGMSSEEVTVFLARNSIKKGDGGGDEEEDITVHVVALKNVEKWLRQKEAEGCVADPKIFAGLYFALQNAR